MVGDRQLMPPVLLESFLKFAIIMIEIINIYQISG